ncbi:MAG: helix-turn-helix domain-containing protein [Firmicutes bacterium]|nr:helix-turn-helix domain-containing protein [Bacillota bacterium]
MIDAVKISKALSDPTRYQILQMLAKSEEGCCPLPGAEGGRPGLCNCEFMDRLGMIQSRVSYHMKELADAGLVTEKPHGKWKIYYLNAAALGQYIDQLNRDFSLK